ncbi:MAG TPA: transglutaminase-like domain-containing protein [Candidatus Polarisedimenticolia bacterium]|nr:transglutaminase-like domain-containing protein [Candidatus Polarisedimenticolia bacterium]
MFSFLRSFGLKAAIAAGAIVSSGFSPPTLPPWAGAIAAADRAPAGEPDDSILVLLSEERVAVQTDGTFRIRQRYAARILSPGQRRLSYEFPFNRDASTAAARAWHLPPVSASAEGPEPVEVHIDESSSTGRLMRRVELQDLREGSLVFFEFETTVRPALLTLSKRFFEDAPVAVARLEVSIPPGWRMRHTWLRSEGPEPAESAGASVWELSDLPAPRRTRGGPSPSARAPQLAINLIPPADARVATPAVPDWRTFSSWYEDLARGTDRVTPEVETLARSLGRPGESAPATPLGRIVAAARHVRDHVRYVPPGRGGGISILPRPAAETLAAGQGDCKDMGTLLRAVLASAGVRSYPLLVHAGEPDTLAEDVPAWGFDHFVVAVPLPPGASIPAHFAGAILHAGELGPMLVIDPTDGDQAIGSLGASLAGRRGLLVAGSAGRLVSLPEAGPSSHRAERRVEAELLPDRSMAVTVRSRLLGRHAASARRAWRASRDARRRGAWAEAASVWPRAEVVAYEAEPETDDGAFEETVRLRVAQADLPDLRRPLSPRAAGLFHLAGGPARPAGRRSSHPRSVRYEVALRGVPPGFVASGAWEGREQGWSLRSEVSQDRRSVRATWDAVFAEELLSAEAVPAPDELWSAPVLAATVAAHPAR